MQHKLHLLYSMVPDFTRAGIILHRFYFNIFLRTFMAWKSKNFNIRRPFDAIDLGFMNVVFQSYGPEPNIEALKNGA